MASGHWWMVTNQRNCVIQDCSRLDYLLLWRNCDNMIGLVVVDKHDFAILVGGLFMSGIADGMPCFQVVISSICHPVSCGARPCEGFQKAFLG
jgi:hypothetical protein